MEGDHAHAQPDILSFFSVPCTLSEDDMFEILIQKNVELEEPWTCASCLKSFMTLNERNSHILLQCASTLIVCPMCTVALPKGCVVDHWAKSC